MKTNYSFGNNQLRINRICPTVLRLKFLDLNLITIFL